MRLARSSSLLLPVLVHLVHVVRRTGNPILPGQPTPKIDVRATPAAERLHVGHARLAADRARRLILAHRPPRSSSPLRAVWDPNAISSHVRRDAQGPLARPRRPAAR